MNVRNLVMPVTLILGIAVGDGNATVGVEGHKGLSIAAHASECSVCHQQQYISEPVISGTVSAGNPFDISFTLANTGAGHSIPEGLFRLIRTRVSIKDVSGQEIFSQEMVYYKKKALLGENPADTDVIKAGETKHVTVPGVVIASPGVYTVSVELLQNSNRVRNTTAFMGATYSTIIVQ